MADEMDPIPDEMSILEASEFWDDHSVADYPTRVVEMSFEKGVETTFVAVERDLVGDLREKARVAGVSVDALVNSWLHEKLAVTG